MIEYLLRFNLHAPLNYFTHFTPYKDRLSFDYLENNSIIRRVVYSRLKPKSNSLGSDKAWKLDLKEKDIMQEGQVSSKYRHYLMAVDDIQLHKQTVSKINCHLLFCHLQ